ncbi:CoA-transferase [Dactylosporangium sp. NPDC051485]|uniref:CoA-transferase n=1 Tax=Dactylosporangium sp. NPDC051485 TaxID=3154846 RepID=UPI0034251335
MSAPDLTAFVAELDDRFRIADNEGKSKVMPLQAALRRYVTHGCTLHVAYSEARPNGALLELARVFAGTRPELTLVTVGLVNLQHALVEMGLVKRIVTSFAGENYPVARPNAALQRALRAGDVTIENWSLWSVVARLAAGALGVSHFPVRSMAGSSMGLEAAARGEYRELDADAPDGGTGTGLVSALSPDVVIMQAVAADSAGNVIVAAPYGEGHWGALAARRGVIACVEKVVDTATIRAMNGVVRIPAHAVLAVCELPYGSHPYGLYDSGVPGVSSYTDDDEFMADVRRASRTPEAFRAWIEEWVTGVPDHAAYLDKIGRSRLDDLTQRAAPDAWRREVTADWLFDGPATTSETQVIATARQLERRVRHDGYQAVLSGVGLSNLAAWVGVDHLHRQGIDIELMAEIGMFGYSPRPGEPYIFAGRNLPSSKMLTDVMGVLGTFVGGPATATIGMVGAGQIDRSGALNSTYTESGDFLVGSGGANDVLSASQEVIVTVGHSPERLVPKVSYVTCPGDRVRSIVTTLGVFERVDGPEYVLTRILPTAGADDRAAVERIRGSMGWSFEVHRDVVREQPPTPEELAALRVYDPHRLFLGDRAPVSAREG